VGVHLTGYTTALEGHVRPSTFRLDSLAGSSEISNQSARPNVHMTAVEKFDWSSR
jgi:hypothetical protein